MSDVDPEAYERLATAADFEALMSDLTGLPATMFRTKDVEDVDDEPLTPVRHVPLEEDSSEW